MFVLTPIPESTRRCFVLLVTADHKPNQVPGAMHGVQRGAEGSRNHSEDAHHKGEQPPLFPLVDFRGEHFTRACLLVALEDRVSGYDRPVLRIVSHKRDTLYGTDGEFAW